MPSWSLASYQTTVTPTWEMLEGALSITRLPLPHQNETSWLETSLHRRHMIYQNVPMQQLLKALFPIITIILASISTYLPSANSTTAILKSLMHYWPLHHKTFSNIYRTQYRNMSVSTKVKLTEMKFWPIINTCNVNLRHTPFQRRSLKYEYISKALLQCEMNIGEHSRSYSLIADNNGSG